MRLLFLFLVLFAATSFTTSAQTLTSPNGKLKLTFSLDAAGELQYDLQYAGRPLLLPGKLGFTVKSGTEQLEHGFSNPRYAYTTEDSHWQPVWGEERLIRNHYNELLVSLDNNSRKVNIRFRLFDDGLGFRYEFPKQDNLYCFVIGEELTEFNLASDAKTFWIPGDYDTNEYPYMTSKVSAIDTLMKRATVEITAQRPIGSPSVQTPLMLKTDNGLYVNIHEAALVDYPAMQLNVHASKYAFSAHLVPDALGGKGDITTPATSPWRTVIVAEDARNILASRIILNLNEPSKIEDTSWIKPTKYIGVWWEMFVGRGSWNYTNDYHVKLEATDYAKVQPNTTHAARTEHVKHYIDFAAKHGFDQVLVEGWNIGWENWINPMREYVFDFVTPYPDFDVKELQRYAHDKGVRLMMHHETGAAATNYEHHIDTAFRFMKQHGYNAVKTGYVGWIKPKGEHHDSQWMVNHYIRVAKKAAQYGIMVNSHEAVRPTGLSRTYPNWLAQESSRGTEFEAMGGLAPEHSTILPFTRLMGGPMDYTPGILRTIFSYYDTNNQGQARTTLTKQLAYYVTMYSPLQMAADLPENYEHFADAFQFIKDVAVDWDTTHYLEAEPGDYLTIARKTKGKEEWFVGGITDEHSRTATVDFSFLPKGRKYIATVYEDAKDADWKTNPMAYRIRTKKVGHKEIWKQKLAPGGGFAIHITPDL